MMFMRASAIACLLLCLAATAEAAVGYQTLSASSGATEPLRVSVWYPSDGEPADTRVGLFVQNVAANAAPSGRQLPLVVVMTTNGKNCHVMKKFNIKYLRNKLNTHLIVFIFLLT